MKKVILSLLVLFLSTFVKADILLSPTENFLSNFSYKLGSLRCFGDTPLYDGESCYSCDEPKNLVGRNVAGSCERICPNRHAYYECGPSCILNNPPDNDYIYIECRGWLKK